MPENMIAYCQQFVKFTVSEPSGGKATISTEDERLRGHALFINTLSDRQDLVKQTIDSCNACKGNVQNCVLKKGG